MINDCLTLIILVLLFAVFGKWLLILILFPFQILSVFWKKKRTIVNKLLAIPYLIFDRKIMHEGWSRYMLYNVSLIPSHHIRRFVYKCLGMTIGKKCVFHFRTEIRGIEKIAMGNGCIIGDNALLDGRCGMEFGNNVNLSSNVSIYTMQHDHRDANFGCVGSKVVVGDRAWIGSNVVVLPGVTIGEGAVCCAGCVVTKDVEAYSVVAGIPAHKVNIRPQELVYEFDGNAVRLL